MGSLPPQHILNGAGHASAPANSGAVDRNATQTGVPRTRAPASDAQYPSQRPSRPQAALAPAHNGVTTADAFVDYSPVLSAIVEMHRFYARQANTQHLEQRLSELELLMRAGTPTVTQKARLRELSTDMSQILQLIRRRLSCSTTSAVWCPAATVSAGIERISSGLRSDFGDGVGRSRRLEFFGQRRRCGSPEDA